MHRPAFLWASTFYVLFLVVLFWFWLCYFGAGCTVLVRCDFGFGPAVLLSIMLFWCRLCCPSSGCAVLVLDVLFWCWMCWFTMQLGFRIRLRGWKLPNLVTLAGRDLSLDLPGANMWVNGKKTDTQRVS